MNREEVSTHAAEQRQAYRKPRLRRIELVAGEVLSEGCKMNGGTLNIGDNPNCGLSSSCVSSGS